MYTWFLSLFLNHNQVLFGFSVRCFVGWAAKDRNYCELNYAMNFSLYYVYFYNYFLWILPMNFAQIIVEIDKRVMFTYYTCTLWAV